MQVEWSWWSPLVSAPRIFYLPPTDHSLAATAAAFPRPFKNVPTFCDNAPSPPNPHRQGKGKIIVHVELMSFFFRGQEGRPHTDSIRKRSRIGGEGNSERVREKVYSNNNRNGGRNNVGVERGKDCRVFVYKVFEI